MKSTREILVTSALVLAALCQASSAPAQVNEARVAFQSGVQSYAERRYAEALESFRTAYRIRPHPSVLVNIANCFVALNRPQDAISTFERFLNDPTVAPPPQQRTEIQTAIAEARRHLATINVLVFPPGAEVYLDGDLVATAPLRRPLQTGPGPHVIAAGVGLRIRAWSNTAVRIDVAKRVDRAGLVFSAGVIPPWPR